MRRHRLGRAGGRIVRAESSPSESSLRLTPAAFRPSCAAKREGRGGGFADNQKREAEK
jgi:hypothetical protein